MSFSYISKAHMLSDLLLENFFLETDKLEVALSMVRLYLPRAALSEFIVLLYLVAEINN
jgi:hypothetical protein